MSSFAVAAVILSYYDNSLRVGMLLTLLNRNSIAYAEKHLPLLKAFLNWEAEISYIMEFGDKNLSYDSFYPNEY